MYTVEGNSRFEQSQNVENCKFIERRLCLEEIVKQKQKLEGKVKRYTSMCK